jgi:hypothetical protein
MTSGRRAGRGAAGAATAARCIAEFPAEDGHQFFDLPGFALRARQLLRIPLGQTQILERMATFPALEFINRHTKNLKFIRITKQI